MNKSYVVYKINNSIASASDYGRTLFNCSNPQSSHCAHTHRPTVLPSIIGNFTTIYLFLNSKVRKI